MYTNLRILVENKEVWKKPLHIAHVVITQNVSKCVCMCVCAALAADPQMYEAYNNLGGLLLQVSMHVCKIHVCVCVCIYIRTRNTKPWWKAAAGNVPSHICVCVYISACICSWRYQNLNFRGFMHECMYEKKHTTIVRESRNLLHLHVLVCLGENLQLRDAEKAPFLGISTLFPVSIHKHACAHTHVHVKLTLYENLIKSAAWGRRECVTLTVSSAEYGRRRTSAAVQLRNLPEKAV